VADVDEFHILALFDYFSGNLVPENQTFWGSCPAAHHVLVRTADVGRHDLQNYPMLDVLTVGVLHLRIVDRLNFYFARFQVNHTSIAWHSTLLSRKRLHHRIERAVWSASCVLVLFCVGKGRIAAAEITVNGTFRRSAHVLPSEEPITGSS